MLRYYARALGLGLAVTAIIIGVALAIDLLGLFGADWRSLALFPLALAALLFATRMVNVGSQMPGFAGDREVYMETVARSTSERGLTDYKPSTVDFRWLLSALPPALAMVLIMAL